MSDEFSICISVAEEQTYCLTENVPVNIHFRLKVFRRRTVIKYQNSL